MSDPFDKLKITLKQHGQSLTRPRVLVFNALDGDEAQSMQQLVARCGQAIDRASVYRTVALFERLGIVQRLHLGWKYKIELSDDFQVHHHHLTCLRCGKTVPLPADDSLEDRLQSMAKAASFQIQQHQIEVQGLCRTCQAAG